MGRAFQIVENGFLNPNSKTNSKCIKDLDVRPEATNLLGKNIGETLFEKLQQYLFQIFLLKQRNKSKIFNMGPK